MVENIARQPLSADLKDLSQMVYLALLEYDEARLQDLWEKNQINFFLARIITNQYHSSLSPYYMTIRKFRSRITETVVGRKEDHVSSMQDVERFDIIDNLTYED